MLAAELTSNLIIVVAIKEDIVPYVLADSSPRFDFSEHLINHKPICLVSCNNVPTDPLGTHSHSTASILPSLGPWPLLYSTDGLYPQFESQLVA